VGYADSTATIALSGVMTDPDHGIVCLLYPRFNDLPQTFLAVFKQSTQSVGAKVRHLNQA